MFTLILDMAAATEDFSPREDTNNPLNRIVEVSGAKDDDWMRAVQRVSFNSPVPINFELLLKRWGDGPPLIKGFEVPGGKFRLGDWLEKVKGTVSSMDWVVSSNTVNVILKQEKQFVTPFDEKAGKEFMFEGNVAVDLTKWLYLEHDFMFGMRYSTYADTHRRVQFAVHPDMTLRDVFNRYTAKAGMDWVATVYDTKRPPPVAWDSPTGPPSKKQPILLQSKRKQEISITFFGRSGVTH
jgi:hypothetical protein